MRAVAAVSGVSIGTLYQYFGTREALLAGWEEHAIRRILSRFSTLVERLLALGPPLEVSIYVLFLKSLGLLEEHLAAYPDGEIEGLFSRGNTRLEQYEQGAAVFVSGLALAGDQDRIREVDRLSMARVVVRMVLDLARQAPRSKLDPDAQSALRRSAARMVVHALVKDADEKLLESVTFEALGIHDV
jgi:AcrR family transcriptional regulator